MFIVSFISCHNTCNFQIMWRFIKGVEKPSTGQKRKTTDEKLNYFKEYEKKRQRSYCPEWEKSYPWLQDSQNGMVCTICTQFCDDRKGNSFITGCQSYKVDSVAKHEKTKNHEKSVLLQKSKTERDVSNSEA